MAESTTVTSLCAKRDELERIIGSYEKSISAARRDLAHVNATLELFERDDAPNAYPSRLSIARMFKRDEIFSLCTAALAEVPEGLDTRELALTVIRAKGMDQADAVLLGFRIVTALQTRYHEWKSDMDRRGLIPALGPRGFLAQ